MLRIMIAVTIVVSLQTVGIALMVAMLVTPAATAFLLTKRMHHMMLLSALFAVAAGIFGLYVSYYVGIPSGASVVLVSTLFFLIVFVGQSMKKKAS